MKNNNNYLKTHPIQALFAKKIGKPNKIYLHEIVFQNRNNKIKEIDLTKGDP